jgi:hypothetical protein
MNIGMGDINYTLGGPMTPVANTAMPTQTPVPVTVNFGTPSPTSLTPVAPVANVNSSSTNVFCAPLGPLVSLGGLSSNSIVPFVLLCAGAAYIISKNVWIGVGGLVVGMVIATIPDCQTTSGLPASLGTCCGGGCSN